MDSAKMSHQSILSFDFATAIVISFIIIRFSPYLNLAHLLVSGIEFIVPPKREDIEKYSAPLKSKGKGTKQSSISPSINAGKIQQGMLSEHFMFSTYDNVVNIFTGVVLLCIFSNIYSCFRQGSSLPFYLVIFACFYNIYALMIPIQLHGLRSYETSLCLMSGFSTGILNFFILQNGQHLVGVNLNAGYNQFLHNVHVLVNGADLPFDPESVQNIPTLFNTLLAIFMGILAMAGFLPVFRFASFFIRLTRRSPSIPAIILMYVSFFLPIVPTVLWFTPMSQFLVEPPFDEKDLTSFECPTRLSWSPLPIEIRTLEIIVWTFLILSAFFKLLVFRKCIRDFLWTHIPTLATFAPGNFENFAKQVVFVNSYVCVLIVQLLAPISLTFLLALAYKLRSGLDFGICSPVGEEPNQLVPSSLLASIIKYVAFSFTWTSFTVSLYCLQLVRKE